MKKSQLRQIIKEEISNVLSEATPVITPLKKISNTEEDIDGLFDEIRWDLQEVTKKMEQLAGVALNDEDDEIYGFSNALSRMDDLQSELNDGYEEYFDPIKHSFKQG